MRRTGGTPNDTDVVNGLHTIFETGLKVFALGILFLKHYFLEYMTVYFKSLFLYAISILEDCRSKSNSGFSEIHAFIIYQAGVSNGDLLIQQKKEVLNGAKGTDDSMASGFLCRNTD